MRRVIDRPNISQEVAATLREMIFLSELAPGEPINEAQLAASLAVSRTPLREALSALVAEKAIDLIPRRGFFVRDLTLSEAKEIYQIRPLLEPEALRLAQLPSEEELAELESINAQFGSAQDAKTAIRHDDQWHLKLIEKCPNRTLVELLLHVIRRTHRYELAVMGQPEVLRASSKQHLEIITALKKGDPAAACELLRTNVSGLAPVLRWLEAREISR
jgi:DNA-binding GntR family transcriptional regulator